MAGESPETNNWNEWKRLVLDKLETLDEGQKEFRTEVREIRVDLAVLKTKAAGWGAIGGAIPVAIGLALHWLSGKKQ